LLAKGPSSTSIVGQCTLCAAAAANLLIPRLPPAHSLGALSLPSHVRDFGHAICALVRNPDASFSMTGTSLFWSIGATLRFLLVAWVPGALGIAGNTMPAYLNAMVAVGVVIGAGLEGKFVTLDKPERALIGGVLIGLAVCFLAPTTSVPLAFIIMAAVGTCGGFFVVPLNTLLQEQGHKTVGAGHAVPCRIWPKTAQSC
jgi:LPLT family lysophospholipid transporter-like MFS transporter